MWRVVIACLLLIPTSTLMAQDRAATDVTTELRRSVEVLRDNGSVTIGDRRVLRTELTLAVYERSGFQPLWTNDQAVEDLHRAILEAQSDGFDSEHYHLSAIATQNAGLGEAETVAELDLLRTDALVRMSRDLRFGKVQPDGPTSAAETPWMFGGDDGATRLVEVVASGRIRDALASLRPRHFVYQGLVRALSDLRRIQAAGGWGTVSPGGTMGLGRADERVPSLRRRLGIGSDPTGEDEEPNSNFDGTVEMAVKAFQHRHGLNEDGMVGEATLAALNVPVERRIDQVRTNLERARWIAHALPDTFIAVNVAGAKVYLLQGDSVAFETRAIVGAEATKTPVFASMMTYIDLNPTWTVPSGVVEEVLTHAQARSDYLTSQGIRVLTASGSAVDVRGIDFSRYTAEDFPYVFRQDPGPLNALGQIKLMFPNEHSIYLHDTPSRGLFAEEARLFSHGCIRVEDPLTLAERVIGAPAVWNTETLERAIATGETRTIDLNVPVPVLILYWTASVDLHGELHFYGDAYDRDEGVLLGIDTDVGQGTMEPLVW